MPKTTYPRDRFDDLPEEPGRVGAHRAQPPRSRGWDALIWALLATAVLIAIGIFGTLIASGRIELFPESDPTPVVETPQVVPVVDTSFEVLILNATPEEGLASQLRDEVIVAGWEPTAVLPGEAATQDFPETTVYYLDAQDEAAAYGLADAIGGARVQQSDVYQPAGDGARQLTIVIGLDSTSAGPAPSATP